MTKHLPPVPPQNQSNKGPGEHRTIDPNATTGDNKQQRNLAEQGRQGNINQNTTNQGFQQDR